ncbi:MAG: hypothetical protein IJU37_08625 [Desulfovibrio sp.]|nr:hypothetical protein [Desulfovibrio sp.]
MTEVQRRNVTVFTADFLEKLGAALLVVALFTQDQFWSALLLALLAMSCGWYLSRRLERMVREERP